MPHSGNLSCSIHRTIIIEAASDGCAEASDRPDCRKSSAVGCRCSLSRHSVRFHSLARLRRCQQIDAAYCGGTHWREHYSPQLRTKHACTHACAVMLCPKKSGIHGRFYQISCFLLPHIQLPMGLAVRAGSETFVVNLSLMNDEQAAVEQVCVCGGLQMIVQSFISSNSLSIRSCTLRLHKNRIRSCELPQPIDPAPPDMNSCSLRAPQPLKQALTMP